MTYRIVMYCDEQGLPRAYAVGRDTDLTRGLLRQRAAAELNAYLNERPGLCRQDFTRQERVFTMAAV